MFYIFISILAGVCIVVSRIINSNLAKKIGIFQSTFFNYVVGLLFSSIFLVFSTEATSIFSISPKAVHLTAYLGGLLGVLVVVLSNYITPRISAFYLTLFIFIGQLFVGIAIDYFSLNILSIGKVVGGILVLAGLAYNLIIDKNKELKAC